jgi:hypothetical protein
VNSRGDSFFMLFSFRVIAAVSELPTGLCRASSAH